MREFKTKRKEGLFSLMLKLNHDKNDCEVTGMGFHPAVTFGFRGGNGLNSVLPGLSPLLVCCEVDFTQTYLEGRLGGILMLREQQLLEHLHCCGSRWFAEPTRNGASSILRRPVLCCLSRRPQGPAQAF